MDENTENKIEEVAERPETAAVDRLARENGELRDVIRRDRAIAGLTAELSRAGARSPGLLAGAAANELQLGDDGAASNSNALIASLKRRFPEQFGYQTAPLSVDGGAGRDPRPVLTRETLAAMTPVEIAALDWADVRRVLAGG